MIALMAKQRYTEGIGRTFGILSQGPEGKMSTHHRKLMREVNQDVSDMIAYRRPAVKYAEEAIQGYMALSVGAKQGRSSFFPPVLHAIVYSRMALEAASMPNVVYKHRLASSEPLMKFINAAKRNAEAGDGNLRPNAIFNWYLQNFDKLLFGVGFRHLTYLLQARTVNIKDSRTGKWKEKYVVEHDDIWDEKLNFFHTGVSRDTLPGMFGGTSAYTDKFFRREVFAIRYKDNPMYFNVDLALAKFTGEFIRVRHYWNLGGDLYCVQAMDADEMFAEEINDGIIIREDYILEYGSEDRPQKMIPITSIHGDFNFDMQVSAMPDFTQGGRAYVDMVAPSQNQSFWTKGNGQLTKGVIGINRAIHRAMHDNMKASTVFFAMSQNPGVLNQLKRADLYGIVPLKADDRSFNVKALLERNQALSGIPEYLQGVDDLAAFAIGHDWRNSASQMTNETATVAAIRENIKNVRAAQNQNMNEAGGISRHYKLLLNLIQQFYPEKTRMELIGGDKVPEGTKEKDIVRDRDGSPIAWKKEKKIPYEEEVVVSVRGGKVKVQQDSEHGEKFIPARKELLCTPEEPEIYIEPGSSFAKMKAIEKALDLERLQHYQFFMGLSYPGENGQPQPLIPKSGAEHLLRKSAEVWEDDGDELLGKEQEEDDVKPTRPFNGSPKPMKPTSSLGGPQPGAPQPGPGGAPTQMMPGSSAPASSPMAAAMGGSNLAPAAGGM